MKRQVLSTVECSPATAGISSFSDRKTAGGQRCIRQRRRQRQPPMLLPQLKHFEGKGNDNLRANKRHHVGGGGLFRYLEHPPRFYRPIVVCQFLAGENLS